MDLKKIVSSILCAAVFTGVIQGTVLAGEPEIITGTYTFTSSEGYNIQLTDDFVFRDDCFTLSSTAGCSHMPPFLPRQPWHQPAAMVIPQIPTEQIRPEMRSISLII